MLKDEISINRNKYFVSPSGKITYTMIGESHPKLAERIVNQNQKLKKYMMSKKIRMKVIF